MKNKKKEAQDISASMSFPGRKMDFGFDFKDLPRHWYGNDAFKTQLMNALSCLFLEGELLFIDSVRDHQDQITDEGLKEQVKSFIKQESIHGREHHMFSEYLDTLGFPATKIEAQERALRHLLKKYASAKSRLAITCAVEHFTALLAHQMLTNNEFSDGMDSRILELWKRHAIEETEHKGVCFDVYEHTGGGHWRRVIYMGIITASFLWRLSTIQTYFLWKDKQLFKWSTWKSGYRFYWKTPGLFPAIWKDYKSYYRRNFHPWEHDNRELLGQWKENHDNYRVI